MIEPQYFGKLSRQICTMIDCVMKLPYINLRIAFYTIRKLINFFTFKDKIPVLLRCNIVYKSTCGDISATYYDKTKCHFKIRMCKYLRVFGLSPKRVYMNNDSSIKKHHFFWNYSSRFDGFTLLASNNNEFKVTLIVSLLIKGDHSPFSSSRSVVLCIKGVFKNITILWGWVSNTSTSSPSVNCSILRTVERNNIDL